MKKIFASTVGVFLAAASAAACHAAEAEGKLQAGDYVAIVGDSITEQKQYSVLIEDYLLMCKPAENLRATQFGWGGETSWGFASRMENDMLRFHCTAATINFGMNDGGYSPETPQKEKQYLDAYTSVVEQMKKGGVRFIVAGSPGCVDSDAFHKDPAAAEMYNKTLAAERDIARKVAEEQGVAFADVYDPMVEVMGIPAGKTAKVTWGKESKEFSAEQLAKGINLAAEFLDNPFAEPFQKVNGAVSSQQGFETPLVKQLIHDLPAYKQAAPEEAEGLERIATGLLKKDKQAVETSAAAVVPVTHTIKIEVP